MCKIIFVILATIIIASALGACGTSDPSTSGTVDPVGVWSVQSTWTSGNCGLTGGTSQALTVTQSDSGFPVKDSDPGVTSESGMVTCTEMECRIDMHEVGGTGTEDSTLWLDDQGQIKGAGMVSVTASDGSCSQMFTATGQIQ